MANGTWDMSLQVPRLEGRGMNESWGARCGCFFDGMQQVRCSRGPMMVMAKHYGC